MPACVLSLIPSAVGQLDRSSVPDGEVPEDLLATLARVVDPRARRGEYPPQGLGKVDLVVI